MTYRSFCFVLAAALSFSFNALIAQERIPPLTRVAADQASANYMRYCALCHGDDREGNKADNAPSLRSLSLMGTMPLDFLASSVAFGRPDTPMAGYVRDLGGPLDMKEIYEMSIWLKQQAAAPFIAMDDSKVEGNAVKGQALYKAKCAECHGEKAEGLTAPALGNPVFLAFASDPFIRYAIANGRDGTQMLAYKEQLSSDEIDDLTAYIRSLASGWQPSPAKLAPYPTKKDYVLNPEGERPEFELKEGRYVPMEQVKKALGQKKRLVLLDTRTTSEWQKAHIPGAIPIPYYVSKGEVAKGLPKDDTWIIAYCGCPHAASDKVIDMLREKGYQHTAVIDEGFFVWLQAGYPIKSGAAK